jgi:NADH-quinone oxidoreductase subunit M
VNQASLHLLEFTLLLPVGGALTLTFIRSPVRAAHWCLGFVLATLFCSIAASLQFSILPETTQRWQNTFAIDNLSAPMLPMLAILHLLTLIGTAKSRVRSSGCVRLLLAESVSLAALTCKTGPVMVVFLLLALLMPLSELARRGKPIRGFAIYMTAFVLLLIAGWWLSSNETSKEAVGMLLVALMLRGGIVPLHGWQPTLFRNASFGMAMLFVLPLVDVLAAIRLVLPVAPSWMLQAGSVACLLTAVYCGALAIVQHDVRRFYAQLCLSQTSLVLFAVMLATPSSLTAALCLWISGMISLAGLGFAIHSLEARFGELSLSRHHGYYEQVPGLAICFFCSGLAAVGFPGTVGFIPMELLISGSIEQGFGISFTLAVVAMLNGLSIMRAYFALFTGRKPTTSVSLQVTYTERVAIIIISSLVFIGGWFSPSVVESRHRVADELLQQRDSGQQ